ncbi:uncharacterized protein [Saccopteryx bilineata]|uniref:uncharacterized protein n=1 Tax=Saccopteryx bilineata TaxID=59482 RepID=UPI00338DC7D9
MKVAMSEMHQKKDSSSGRDTTPLQPNSMPSSPCCHSTLQRTVLRKSVLGQFLDLRSEIDPPPANAQDSGSVFPLLLCPRPSALVDCHSCQSNTKRNLQIGVQQSRKLYSGQTAQLLRWLEGTDTGGEAAAQRGGPPAAGKGSQGPIEAVLRPPPSAVARGRAPISGSNRPGGGARRSELGLTASPRCGVAGRPTGTAAGGGAAVARRARRGGSARSAAA